MKHKQPLGSKPIKNVSSLSTLSLKAALYDSSASKLLQKKTLNKISSSQHPTQHSTHIVNQSNQNCQIKHDNLGKNEKMNSERNAFEIEDEDQKIKLSRMRLMEKAKLYNDIVKRKVSLDENKQDYNVNFEEKSLVEQSTEDHTHSYGTMRIIDNLMKNLEEGTFQLSENLDSLFDDTNTSQNLIQKRIEERKERMRRIIEKRKEWLETKEKLLNFQKRSKVFD